ncbi:hypothetical protein HRK28_04615 [Rathayibacter sp. VKM Ac-2835]|uniref:DUF6907 domain-containing protein n=1 Tax=Rathayibacter sp. VKM Ac-2835 TaxID=2739043 RepID=UPI0015669763|nr:hypothetical protein [Rathayibacter sp. VKM Ac-2835]NRG40197.1 hypothetical protein [Rathayibacter sp. VKM Ac-2835]
MIDDFSPLRTPCPSWCTEKHDKDTYSECSHTSGPLHSEGLPVQVLFFQLDERDEDGRIEIGQVAPALWNVAAHCEVIDIDGPEQLLLIAAALTQAAAVLTRH